MPERISVTTENDITQLLLADSWRTEVLSVAEKVDLPNWWIGAGFLRNIIWDAIEGNSPRQERDVDLVYYNKRQVEPEVDWEIDDKLKKQFPFAEWEVRNQARMHYVNSFDPYTSTEDGIAHWVETATCIAVRLRNGQFEYLFCHGTDDLFNLVARPIQEFQTAELLSTFYSRIEMKQWRERWPSLRVVEE